MFGRGHGSAYGALAEGAVGVEALRDLLAAARPPGWPLVFAVDGTSFSSRETAIDGTRPESESG